jgi:hypothetical protein
MADSGIPSISPVAADIKTPDVMGTLGSIMDLMGKRQDIAVKQQQLQQQAMVTQKMQEIRNFHSTYKPLNYIGPDGTTDIDKVTDSPEFKKLSLAQPDILDQLYKTKGDQQGIKQSVLKIAGDQRQRAGDSMAPFLGDPDVQAGNPEGVRKLKEGWENTWNQPGMDRNGPNMQALHQMFAAVENAKGDQLLPALRLGLNYLGWSPKNVPLASGQVGLQEPSGFIREPPSEQIGGRPTPSFNPSQPYVAGQAEYARGQAESDNARSNLVSNAVEPSRKGITYANDILAKAHEIKTGKWSQATTDFMTNAHLDSPEAAARQLVGKDLENLQSLASVGAPDAEARENIRKGYPSLSMQPDALKNATEMVKGNLMQNLSRAANQRRFTDMHGSNQGFRNADDKFTSQADSLMYSYNDLKTDAERKEFIGRHFRSRAEFDEWLGRKNSLAHFHGFEQ